MIWQETLLVIKYIALVLVLKTFTLTQVDFSQNFLFLLNIFYPTKQNICNNASQMLKKPIFNSGQSLRVALVCSHRFLFLVNETFHKLQVDVKQGTRVIYSFFNRSKTVPLTYLRKLSGAERNT